ncbi:MAG: phosphotransferase family protein [Ktedonobacteraceae bacterium]
MDDKVSTDKSKLVQSDAALDIDRLADFLRTHFDNAFDAASFSVERFTQGYSNLTYLLHIGERELVLRRPPIGATIKSGHDMAREYRLLSGLYPIYPKVPRAVLYSDDLSVLGAPFYIMERVKGVVLQREPPAGLALSPETMEQISRAFIENMVVIHELDYTTTELKSFARPGSYVERQISGWLDRYQKAKTDDLPELERAGRWLASYHLPDAGSSLIHNDYKYDNLMLDPDNLAHIVAVLDWEMATIGDPLMDLGTSLAYWVQQDDPAELQAARMGMTNRPGNFSRPQLVHEYALRSGREAGEIVFYYVYGLFKIAVIAQQIYARYKKGVASDERFAQLPRLIQAEGITAVQAIEKNRIDQLSL